MNDCAAIIKRSMEDESILGIETQEETPTEHKAVGNTARKQPET